MISLTIYALVTLAWPRQFFLHKAKAHQSHWRRNPASPLFCRHMNFAISYEMEMNQKLVLQLSRTSNKPRTIDPSR